MKLLFRRDIRQGDRTHEVPLSDLAVEVLAALPRLGTYGLTTRGYRLKPGQELRPDRDRPVSGYSKIKAALDARLAALAREEAAGTDAEADAKPGWRFHDLRRTAGKPGWPGWAYPRLRSAAC